jgi:cell division protein ZapA (FtsZ GTPase activity inhibitor)
MIATTREAVITEITDDVKESLRHLKPLTKTYRHERTALVTTIELYDVAQARQLGPSGFTDLARTGG